MVIAGGRFPGRTGLRSNLYRSHDKKKFLNRWEKSQVEPSGENLEKLYSYAYRKGIRLNRIKEQFYREELPANRTLLFHGAKSVIDGVIRWNRSRTNNDFGQGFYMGESFRQAALFVSNFRDSSVYCLSLNEEGLIRAEYAVDTEWMLTVACFRGRLRGRISKEREEQVCGKALAATELGMQYVARSARAAERTEVLERCYLCASERHGYASARRDDLRTAEDKVRAARIQYRGKGKYIDELL